MLSFSRLLLTDIEWVRPYFAMSQTGICDNTVGGCFMWRDYFQTEYALWQNTLIFKVRYFRNTTAFTFPLGDDADGALTRIFEYCSSLNIPAVFCTVTDGNLPLLMSRCNASAVKEHGWSDYIYAADSLSLMTGKKFNGQRNHMNRFKREHPDYRFETLCDKNIPDVAEFFRLLSSDDGGSPTFAEERSKVFEVLDNYSRYGMDGVVLYADGKVAAFCAGEIVGETLFVHIEKADTSFGGAYQMIVSEFARRGVEAGALLINREEDVGDEGLRTSKLSYHPLKLIDKYTVTKAD